MPPYNLSGKYAVLTGGGSGITLHFIHLLLASGTSVIVGDLRLRPEAEELAAQHPHPPQEPNNASFVFHKTDVTSWPQLSSLWNTALATFPQVDLVVPGAGILEPSWSSLWYPPGVEGPPSTDAPDAEPGTYATLNVNLVHPIRLAQLAVAYWTRSKIKGNMLLLGSVAGYTSTIHVPLYHVAKAGLHSFVKSLAPMNARMGIRVACVAPGPVRTPLWESGLSLAKLGHYDPALKPEFVAELMLEVCTSEKYGHGNIVECLESGTLEKPNPTFREVPCHLLYPSFDPALSPTLAVEEEHLWKRLETSGFKA
ncbi:uncharacterized protein PpBr36_06755 [Pyricularia pennisetigena]|uniref:uncharacterized protein n=1 Tax=Pyricularia pennisetigena TaxID=1578925 RepID=UPI00114EA180|nr:uncharacterized protein PpBr36_06755 [Pyricularia pennisetigena]TLS23056.1 hypothetical protein PpBr36_06755 [Pyricularia pennisetigena]